MVCARLPVLRYSVNKAYHTWKNFNRQLFDKPGSILYEDADEPCIIVLGSYFLHDNFSDWRVQLEKNAYSEMFVHDLTSLEIWVIEMDHTAHFSSVGVSLSIIDRAL